MDNSCSTRGKRLWLSTGLSKWTGRLNWEDRMGSQLSMMRDDKGGQYPRLSAGHFLRERSGAAMVEFAMTGAMFLLSILWLMEVGLTYVTTLELESATRDVARIVRTNRSSEVNSLAVPGGTEDADKLAVQFGARVCARLVFSADCANDVKVFVRSAGSFEELDALTKPPADPFSAASPIIGEPWKRSNFVIVTAFWKSPFSVFTDNRIIQAAAVTRNEP